MAKAAKSVADEQAESTDLVVMATVNPVAVFTDREQYSAFYEKLKAETAKHEPNVATERGRAEIRKLAFKVTKAKTTLDKAGLGLTEEWRQKVAMVNEARKQMVTELDQLAKEVRRPLTEWEEAEEARVERCQAVIAQMKAAAVVSLDDTSETVRARGGDLWKIQIDDEEFGDLAEEARSVKEASVATLQRAMERLTKEEQDRAELERLRAAEAERERIKAEQEEIERAAEQRRSYARTIIEHIRQCGLGMIGGRTYPYAVLIRELEEKIAVSEDEFGDMAGDVEKARVETLAHVREAAEKEAERARQEAAEKAAEEARQEEARRAQAAEEERQREHEAALAEQRRRADEAERIAREEREEREREEAENKRIAEEQRAEQARRDADREHRAKVQAAAKDALKKLGLTAASAEKVVLAIIAGEIPAVSLRF